MALWRVFPTVGQAEAYCRQCYVGMVRQRAATLTRQELDDHWNLPGKVRVPDLPDAQINGSRFPLYGRNQATGAWNATSGYTTAWAEPRQTADGDWAAQAIDPADPLAVPEPTWPDPGPVT